jgi:uroporphyrin-III C-methyltransferase
MSAPMTSSPPALHPVALVGAGPGDPELLTLKAARALAAADVVLVDALVPPVMLAPCRPDARVLDVGKLGYGRHTPQEVICRLLAEEALAGRRVVRLKGGDPFVFGRGGEEALYLAERGLPFEVIPGISSAIAAPAAAQIPVTQRGVVHSFTVVTGSAARHGALLADNWAALAKAGGTLVFLMALRPLRHIVERLREGGLRGDMPCAMIQAGTRDDMRVVDGQIATIADDVAEAGLGSPALLVVGDVCEVRSSLLALAAQVPAPSAPTLGAPLELPVEPALVA